MSMRYAVLSMGDPCGTSPEIIIKTVRSLSATPDAGIIVAGDRGVFQRVADDLSIPLPFGVYADNLGDLAAAEGNGEQLIFFSSSSIDMSGFAYGAICAEGGYASYHALEAAVDIIQNGYGQSLVTCPVSGVSLAEAGYEERTVHALLRRFAQSDRLSNMLFVGNMNVFSLTHRRSMESACSLVSREKIIEALIQIDALRVSSYFDKEKPIAVGSLNPQFEDGGWTGREEEDAIIPAVDILQKLGMNVVGPLSPEKLFSMGAKGAFSAMLAMTINEAFAACSASAPDETLIVTWGLPFLRIGLLGDVGFESAGSGNASIKGMLRAVYEALLLRDSSFMA